MTNEELITGLRHIAHTMERNGDSYYQHVAEDAIQALEQQPSEDTEVIKVSKGAVKARQGRFVIYDVEWLKKNFYSTEEKIYGQPKQPCEDCISRKQALDTLKTSFLGMSFERYKKAKRMFEQLPSTTPKYTDEEIDKAQAVEQAYVDKMVELVVEETKERYSDAIKKMRKTIDEMTEIHSDGEFYIKNVDAKWIISKYLCGAEGRPKGRWIATENEEMNIVGYYCSFCDLPMETEERTKYCPNCGAEMGGADETN